PGNRGGKEDQGDVWGSEMTSSGDWTDAVNLGNSLNDASMNRILGFMDHGKAMLLHSEKGVAFAYNYNGNWLKPTIIEVPYFKYKSDHISGSISSDGRYLIFGMESYGTYGVEDLYMCKLKTDGTWTNPKNLGSGINTPYQEITPFLAADNKTIFFSTNGREGEGSFDIFMSQRLDDTWLKWTEPVNLGPKVNTKGQDLSFVFREEAEYAYLISTQNSDGYGDLKRVKIKPEIEPEKFIEEVAETLVETLDANKIRYEGKILDKKTKLPIANASVEIIGDPDGLRYMLVADTLGNFEFSLTESLGYELKIHASNYLGLEELVTIEDARNELPKEFLLESLVKGNTIELSHVLFQQGQQTLIPGSEKELDLVFEMMSEHSDINIFLSGHTDNQGPAALNLNLSNDRVETVKQYLISKGINQNRISGRGHGGSKPIASNDNSESRKRNRRVEFTIQ
ncbi:MAG: OmpA family protein, partial [Cyclobacteriaceae bacterium]|nr:OmpA family protein [Cyclobacteriaceae bacterium]